MSVPLHNLYFSSDVVQGVVSMGVRPSLPVEGVDVILGNNLADKLICPVVPPSLLVSSLPLVGGPNGAESNPEVYPVCAVTRAVARVMTDKPVSTKIESVEFPVPDFPLSVSRSQFRKEQKDDSTLQ